MTHRVALASFLVFVALAGVSGLAQNPQTPAPAARTDASQFQPAGIRGRGGYALPALPATFFSFQHRVRVSVVAQGLDRPWCLLILPDGEMLISMRYQNEIRAIRKGALAPTPLAGLPPLRHLFDIVAHPGFAQNHWVYLVYSTEGEGRTPMAIARARYEGETLKDVKEVFRTDPVLAGNPGASRMAFAPDGTLYVTISGVGGRIQNGPDPRQPDTDYGKVIRIRDDGSVPTDNPFVGRADARPEIYSMGHRDHFGLAPHPVTGQMFHTELGPYGGDKVNVLKPGGDYGWPDYGYGRNNDFSPLGIPAIGIEPALLVWLPGITPSGMLFYTGDRFPGWKNNLFVGSIQRGRINGSTGVERVTFNDKMWETSRETFLAELKQRIRDIRQGPDGLIYLLTEETNGAVLRIEPVVP
jgi:glucose/arabinose dehydrogenase